MPRYLDAIAVTVSAVAFVVLTIVDIARRPPGKRAAQAWVDFSTPRAVALAVFLLLFFVGALILE